MSTRMQSGNVHPLDIADCINKTCPWSGEPVQGNSLTKYGDHVVGFCNPGCRDKFESAVRHFELVKGQKAEEGWASGDDLNCCAN